MSSKSRVVLHHSATPDSGTLSWNAIRRFHVETNGWKDIGYHLGCELLQDSTGAQSYEVLLGRPLDQDGAHCYQDGLNRTAIGFCFIGDFDAAPPPAAMLHAAARHLGAVMRELGIDPTPDNVRMHRQHATYKTCPGTSFPYDDFLRMLQGS